MGLVTKESSKEVLCMVMVTGFQVKVTIIWVNLRTTSKRDGGAIAGKVGKYSKASFLTDKELNRSKEEVHLIKNYHKGFLLLISSLSNLPIEEAQEKKREEEAQENSQGRDYKQQSRQEKAFLAVNSE